MTAGATSVEETVGWLVEAGISATTGSLLWIQNRTGGIYTPYTRLTNTPSAAAGVYVEINQATYEMVAYSYHRTTSMDKQSKCTNGRR